ISRRRNWQRALLVRRNWRRARLRLRDRRTSPVGILQQKISAWKTCWAPEHGGRLPRPKKKRARTSSRLKLRHTSFKSTRTGLQALEGKKDPRGSSGAAQSL